MKILLLLFFSFPFIPFNLYSRAGGGCLIEGTNILTENGYKKIEEIKENDKVYSVKDNRIIKTKVKKIYSTNSEKIIHINACSNDIYSTEEHPFMIGDGYFKKAKLLKTNDFIFIYGNNNNIRKCKIEYINVIITQKKVYNLLTYPYENFIAKNYIVHNKGCFLPDTYITMADNSQKKISELKNGDEVLSFDEKGDILKTKILNIIKILSDDYYVIKTDYITVKVTGEHPFYIGNGVFKIVDKLKIGDEIYYYDGKSKFKKQRIIDIQKIKEKNYVYNLQTDWPNTFFANYTLVHNKGGGCFTPDTQIITPNQNKKIKDIKKGDIIYSYDNGSLIKTTVKEIHITYDRILKIKTNDKILNTTREHPTLTKDGFKNAGDIKKGDKIAYFDKNLIWIEVKDIELSNDLTAVYNLSVDKPNTFIADGFVVHNKGGFGYSHYYSSSGTMNPTTAKIFTLIGILIIVFSLLSKKGEEYGELDYLFSKNQIEEKTKKTEKLLEFLSKQDKNLDINYLKNTVRDTFLKVQYAWQNRNYEPIKDLITTNLYIKHKTQLDIMKNSHEINIVENLELLSVDLVGLRYTIKENGRFFTALITAKARDYYTDDRTGEFLRGDDSPSMFQEFWIFKFEDGKWKLDDIEQTAESDILSKEDFVEEFTDERLKEIYNDKTLAPNITGPAIPKEVVDKTNKITNMINFLGETDKMWNMGRMEIDASLSFLNVYKSWSSLDPDILNPDYITIEMLNDLRNIITEKKNEGYRFEFRNLCIRKVDIVLVYNMADNQKDEYVVRFTAHAQKMVYKNSDIIYKDDYVKAFTEYWLFGKENNKWKLKEILPRNYGENAIYKPNKDEDSTPAQLEWYYTKKRTY